MCSFIERICSAWRLENKTTMTSSKADGTAAAAKQLASISLDKSAERKENDAEPSTENGTSSAKMCSACGKKSDTLKKCIACKCVWYCDKDCQNKHWKEHKAECKRIKKILGKRGGKLDLGTEKDVGPLPDLPPQEMCPICLRVMPLDARLHVHSSCCGKVICGGCDMQHHMKCGGPVTCAFCREPAADSDEENIARLSKRIDRKNPKDLCDMALAHGYGQGGLPLDQAKCIDLLRQSGDLGYPLAHYKLACFHDAGAMGLEQNEEEANKYYKEAAEGGHVHSRHNIGNKEGRNGNHVAAMLHFRLAASQGSKSSMSTLLDYFEGGLLHHGDLADTLQAFYVAKADRKSNDRDMFLRHLIMTGEYEERFGGGY